MEVRFAVSADAQWLAAHDPHVDADWVRRCILAGEYLVASSGPDLIGFLRFSLFWGKVPYMDLIWISEDQRRHGVGTALLRYWQQAMQERGAKVLMTSAMSDEPEPQSWHQRNGFKPSGSLTFGRFQEVPEVFFVMDIPED